MKGIIYIDVKKCLGCKTCQIECALIHSKFKNLLEYIFTSSPSSPRIDFEEIREMVVPIQCSHCEAPSCVAICPTGAIYKSEKEGAIVINQSLCVGCGACVIVCPYGIPTIKNGKAMTKCDLCFELLQKSIPPACVSGCPTKSLKFKKISET